MRRSSRRTAAAAMARRWSTSWPDRRPAASSSPSRPPASSASGAIFAEEVRADDGTTRREFRRGFRIEPGERVLLVDDILTTGGSLLAMLPAVEAMGGEIVECLVLVDRSGGRATLTSPSTGRIYPLRSLWQLDLPTYEPGPATCPRCAAGHAAPRAGQHRHGRDRRPPPRELTLARTDGGPRTGTCSRWSSSLVVALTGAAAVLLGGGPPDRAGPPATRPRSSGSSSASSPRASTEVQRLHAADDRRGDASRSRSATSRTAPSSRRATSPSTRRPPSRSGSGTGPRAATKVAIRLEDAP